METLSVPIVGYTQTKPDVLFVRIDMIWNRHEELQGLALLRAVEILRNAGWDYPNTL